MKWIRDFLDVLDIEGAILAGEIEQKLTHDPRGTRYVITGAATDEATNITVVVRFVERNELLVLTVIRKEVDETMYDFSCEHCAGTVRERRSEREAIRHKGSFVILEDVPIGICDQCGARYFHASVLRRAAEIGRGATAPLRTVVVPVGNYAPTLPS